MWEIGRRLGHYGEHPHAQVADRGTPSRMDKRVAPDREGAADKQCQGEGKLWSQYVITNHEEGKGKPPRLFPKTGYPLRISRTCSTAEDWREREKHAQTHTRNNFTFKWVHCNTRSQVDKFVLKTVLFKQAHSSCTGFKRPAHIHTSNHWNDSKLSFSPYLSNNTHTHTHTTVLLLFWNMSGTTLVSRKDQVKPGRSNNNGISTGCTISTQALL